MSADKLLLVERLARLGGFREILESNPFEEMTNFEQIHGLSI